jgi:hypothetical protein
MYNEIPIFSRLRIRSELDETGFDVVRLTWLWLGLTDLVQTPFIHQMPTSQRKHSIPVIPLSLRNPERKVTARTDERRQPIRSLVRPATQRPFQRARPRRLQLFDNRRIVIEIQPHNFRRFLFRRILVEIKREPEQRILPRHKVDPSPGILNRLFLPRSKFLHNHFRRQHASHEIFLALDRRQVPNSSSRHVRTIADDPRNKSGKVVSPGGGDGTQSESAAFDPAVPLHHCMNDRMKAGKAGSWAFSFFLFGLLYRGA